MTATRLPSWAGYTLIALVVVAGLQLAGRPADDPQPPVPHSVARSLARLAVMSTPHAGPPGTIVHVRFRALDLVEIHGCRLIVYGRPPTDCRPTADGWSATIAVRPTSRSARAVLNWTAWYAPPMHTVDNTAGGRILFDVMQRPAVQEHAAPDLRTTNDHGIGQAGALLTVGVVHVGDPDAALRAVDPLWRLRATYVGQRDRGS
jgi:hypothetical protein